MSAGTLVELSILMIARADRGRTMLLEQDAQVGGNHGRCQGMQAGGAHSGSIPGLQTCKAIRGIHCGVVLAVNPTNKNAHPGWAS